MAIKKTESKCSKKQKQKGKCKMAKNERLLEGNNEWEELHINIRAKLIEPYSGYFEEQISMFDFHDLVFNVVDMGSPYFEESLGTILHHEQVTRDGDIFNFECVVEVGKEEVEKVLEKLGGTATAEDFAKKVGPVFIKELNENLEEYEDGYSFELI